MKKLYIILLSILLLTSCQNAVNQINKDIPVSVDVTSAQELISVSSQYVTSLWGKADYYIGKVYMSLNKDLVGNVEITFTDNSSKEPPRMVVVEIDTLNKKIIKLRQLSRAHKLYPGKIRLIDWKIDNSRAFDIAKQFLGGDTLQFDEVVVRTFLFENGKEYNGVWLISFYDCQKEITHFVKMNPYSGEILNYVVSQWPS